MYSELVQAIGLLVVLEAYLRAKDRHENSPRILGFPRISNRLSSDKKGPSSDPKIVLEYVILANVKCS